MPDTLTGDYYLVMVADAGSKFDEQDEENNLFYVTGTNSGPIRFSNGVQQRRGVEAGFSFANPLSKPDFMAPQAKQFNTAVNASHRNAYSPEEIVSMLRHKVKTGEYAQMVSAFKANRNNAHTTQAATR
jgi:hypothetical protein